ncbi:MAG: imelysin family protein [Myxococcales bacterium]
MGSQSLRAGFLVALGFAMGCDKLALPEHVSPMAPASNPGVGGHLDSGMTFVPSTPSPTDSDGGAGDAGIGSAACAFLTNLDAPFSKSALLTSVAQCTQQQLCQFDPLAVELETKLAAYAAAPSPESLTGARDAWYHALQQWQILEMFGFGPQAPKGDPGGEGLRDEIYAFPAVNRCSMEEQLYDQTYAGSTFDMAPAGARGLGAVEYMLFYTNTDNGCTALNRLNGKQLWSMLSAEELANRKVAYAGALGHDIRAKSALLLSAWSASGGNFAQTLASAGPGGAVYMSEQAALNAVSNGLFYLEQDVKQWKLGRPAGLVECTANCAGYAETRYARVASDNVRANLKAFRLLYQGCGPDYQGLGFDDWLHAVGADSVADEMSAALDAADAAIAQFDLNGAFEQNPGSVAPVYAAFKAISDVLKTDVITVLNLDAPMMLVGDND